MKIRNLRNDRTQASGTQQASERHDEMDKEDTQIAHLLILTNPAIAWDCATNQQFAIVMRYEPASE